MVPINAVAAAAKGVGSRYLPDGRVDRRAVGSPAPREGGPGGLPLDLHGLGGRGVAAAAAAASLSGGRPGRDARGRSGALATSWLRPLVAARPRRRRARRSRRPALDDRRRE